MCSPSDIMENVQKPAFYAAVLICWIALVMIFPVTTTAMTTLVATSVPGCPDNCTCEMSDIICTGWIPDTVPDTIETVVLKEINDQEDLNGQRRFCNVTWDNVNDLTIIMSVYSFVDLHDDDLYCLSQLKAIAIRNQELFYPFLGFTNKTFSSLSNVTTVDLSGWDISMLTLQSMFSVRTNIPQLTHLNLSRSNFPLELNQNFINGLSTRPLQFLDISSRDITFDFLYDRGLCQTFTNLIMHDSLIKIEMLPKWTCASLRFVDISRTNDLAMRLKQRPCVNDRTNLLPDTDFSATTVHANELIASTSGMHISNCQIWLRHDVRELSFSQNVIPRWEFLFGSSYSHTGLRHIEISRNNIKTINQNTWAYSLALEKIDLSHNKLSEIPPVLFQNNKLLLSVDLTSNSLSSLPVETFLSNSHLEVIRIANNSFTQIHFTITHLDNLTTLDVRFNQIHFLDSQSMNVIETLQKKQRDERTVATNITGTLQVLLEGNPFSCDCNSLEFLRWFATSPVFTSDRQTYRCTSQGRKISMVEAGIDAAQEDCELAARQLRTILLSTFLSLLGLAATVVTTIGLCKRYKRKKLQKKLTDQLRLIQEENTGCMFPVFLSYCSEDAPFVAQHVRQPLRQHLRAYTDVDRELVCEGDLHFVPGRNTFNEIERCVAESAVFLAVVSESYCKSYYCNMEISEAKTTGKPIILIMKEHVDISKMELVVKNTFKNYARSWMEEENGQYSVKPGWDKICEGIITAM